MSSRGERGKSQPTTRFYFNSKRKTLEVFTWRGHLIHCSNGIALKVKGAFLNNYTWTVGAIGNLGFRFSLVLSSTVT